MRPTRGNLDTDSYNKGAFNNSQNDTKLEYNKSLKFKYAVSNKNCVFSTLATKLGKEADM
jgi:hypothetical protein